MQRNRRSKSTHTSILSLYAYVPAEFLSKSNGALVEVLRKLNVSQKDKRREKNKTTTTTTTKRIKNLI